MDHFTVNNTTGYTQNDLNIMNRLLEYKVFDGMCGTVIDYIAKQVKIEYDREINKLEEMKWNTKLNLKILKILL